MNEVVVLHEDFKRLHNILWDKEHIERYGTALAGFVDVQYKKVLLLAAVSRFEQDMTDAISQLLQDELVNDHPLEVFVRNAAIDRKFYSWFTWTEDNEKGVHRFFSLFGKKFGKYARDRLNSNDCLKRSAGCFIRLGNLRNKLVHRDFAVYSMEETSAKDIYDRYHEAKEFVAWVPDVLRTYISEIRRL